ncbi:MAG: aspartate kinase [Sedimentisphaerales bacterium]|nr:aspartate kinase [Sedimentisphaerales bacterium]
MELIVQKFGGTSVADAERIHRAARRAIRAKQEGNKVVMVVSAMGKSTDKLISLARDISDDPPRRELDMLLTTGEQVSISLMAMAIHAAGHEAISLTGGQIGLITDSVHTKARIQKIGTDRIRQELENDRIVIVAGFQGIDESGEIYTLGRGASDTTAVALAAVLGAKYCEIYTDVDGVYTTDPRIEPKARKIEWISYDEILELASQGAGVMHSRAIEFGKKYNVEIHVRSSFTDFSGTWITHEEEHMEHIVVSGVTVKKDLAQFVLAGVPNQPGVAANIFAHVAEHGVVVDDIIQTFDQSGHASISFTVEESDLSECKLVAEEIRQAYNLSEVICKEPVAKVSAVGVGMRSHTGVAQKMFKALAEAEVNINTITTSEIKISCVIDPDQADDALRVIHAAFELDKEPE